LGRHRAARTGFARAVCAVAVFSALLCSAAFARPFTVEDLYRLQTISDARVSPDGAWVVYTVSTPNRERDADDADLWLADWQGRRSVRLTGTSFSEHSPRWSPEGQWIAFLTDRGDEDAGDQIWLLPREGGEARQLSHFGAAITSFAWSPDGKRMVFSAKVSPPPDDSSGASPESTKDDARPQPIVIDRLQFKLDEAGYLRKQRMHLFLLDVGSGVIRQLTDGPFDERQPAWSPDGSRIAFLSKRGADPDASDNWDVFIIGTENRASARQLTTSPGMDGDPDEEWGSRAPELSADGSHIAYVARQKPEDTYYSLSQVSVATTQDGAASLPTAPLDRNTMDPQWSADGRWIYFRLEDDLSVVLARVRVRDGHVERLTSTGGTVTEFDIGRGGRIAVVHTTDTKPAEVYALEGRRLRPLSRHNDAWLREMDVASARAIQFKSRDGTMIRGLMIIPAGAAGGASMGRWPTVLRLHGGPVAQHQHEFDVTWQLFASQGYVVLGPNPRGSSGRGYAFQKSLFAEWGYADVPDVLAAADYAANVGLADPQRLGIGGWSYGAILTNYVIASDTRFKAATSGAGMGNMLAGYGDDQYVREWEIELGLPWENTERWIRLSYPFLHADRIKTPTLFLVGEQDYNVPPIGSEQMYQALRRLHVPTQLVIYPGQYHGFDRPGFRADRARRYLDWYGRYLGTTAPASGAPPGSTTVQ